MLDSYVSSKLGGRFLPMDKNKENTYGIIFLVIICCVIMAIIETVIEPAYIVKSAIKVSVFLFFPFVYAKATNLKLLDGSFILDKKSIVKLLLLGAFIYAAIIGAFAATKNVFDYSALIDALSTDQRVDGKSFIWVALYISFGNSFLEEFLFRFISFIKLSKFAPRKIAYMFSSVIFAVYHAAMIGSSFPLPLLLLVLLGLAVGGCIFDYVDEKSENIYNSWIIHMFADFAIMTIWYIHI